MGLRAKSDDTSQAYKLDLRPRLVVLVTDFDTVFSGMLLRWGLMANNSDFSDPTINMIKVGLYVCCQVSEQTQFIWVVIHRQIYHPGLALVEQVNRDT